MRRSSFSRARSPRQLYYTGSVLSRRDSSPHSPYGLHRAHYWKHIHEDSESGEKFIITSNEDDMEISGNLLDTTSPAKQLTGRTKSLGVSPLHLLPASPTIVRSSSMKMRKNPFQITFLGIAYSL